MNLWRWNSSPEVQQRLYNVKGELAVSNPTESRSPLREDTVQILLDTPAYVLLKNSHPAPMQSPARRKIHTIPLESCSLHRDPLWIC